MSHTDIDAISIIPNLAQPSSYKDRHFQGTDEEWIESLQKSCTLYVGNLSFYTTEEQLYELFGKAGDVKRIVMGLDRNNKTPCGFCFVEYYTHDDAANCMKYINGTKLDDRFIRTDLDPGFKPGRQFGRGRSGGQVRDEHRTEYDAGRGGWGARMRHSIEPEIHGSSAHLDDQNMADAPAIKENPRFRNNDQDEEDF